MSDKPNLVCDTDGDGALEEITWCVVENGNLKRAYLPAITLCQQTGLTCRRKRIKYTMNCLTQFQLRNLTYDQLDELEYPC